MLKQIPFGLDFDEYMTCAGGDIPIVGVFTRGWIGRKFVKTLEHLLYFYCSKGFIFIFCQHGRDYHFYGIPTLKVRSGGVYPRLDRLL